MDGQNIRVKPPLLNLRWNNHVENLIAEMKDELTRGINTDVILACAGRFIKAHTIILGFFSQRLRKTIERQQPVVENPGEEDVDFVIDLNPLKLKAVCSLIEFMYTGQVNIENSEDLENVLIAAEYLQVKGLRQIPATAAAGLVDLHQNQNYSNGNENFNNYDPEEESKIYGPEFTRRQDEADDEEVARFTQQGLIRAALERVQKMNHPDVMNKDSLPLLPPPPRPEQEQGHQEQHEHEQERIRRPMNAFMIFANEWRRRLAGDYPNDDNKAISTRLGTVWRHLPMEHKQQYYEASERASEEHKIKYPDYHYKPQEARRQKQLRKESQQQRRGTQGHGQGQGQSLTVTDPRLVVQAIYNGEETNRNET